MEEKAKPEGFLRGHIEVYGGLYWTMGSKTQPITSVFYWDFCRLKFKQCSSGNAAQAVLGSRCGPYEIVHTSYEVL